MRQHGIYWSTSELSDSVLETLVYVTMLYGSQEVYVIQLP